MVACLISRRLISSSLLLEGTCIFQAHPGPLYGQLLLQRLHSLHMHLLHLTISQKRLADKPHRP